MAPNNKIRVIFFGTPQFAVPSLSALFKSSDIELAAVVTQTEKPKGRGKLITASEVNLEAQKLGLKKILTPKSLKSILLSPDGVLTSNADDDPDLTELLSLLKTGIDFGIVIAYGKIIPIEILNSAKHCFLNVHPSTLPRWRGAAPLQHTIFSGDKNSSICIIKLIKELDAGPIFFRHDFMVGSNETYGSLHDRVSTQAAPFLLKTCIEISQEKIQPVEQDIAGVTYAHKWTKNDCHIDWSENAETCVNRINASAPKPGAFTFFDKKIFKIHQATLGAKQLQIDGPNGTLYLESNSRLMVKCNENQSIELLQIQIEGRNKISTTDFLNSGKFREKLGLEKPVFFTSE